MNKEVNITIHVGQTMYRALRNDKISEDTVSKVGRKYFYLTNMGQRYPIDKKTLKYTDRDYSLSSFQLYLDKQEILDTKERAMLYYKLQKHFQWSGGGSKNTLEQLRKAVEALGIS